VIRLWDRFTLTKRHLLIAAAIVVIAGVNLWHGGGSLTLAEIAALPVDRLQAVHVTRGGNVFPVEPAKWEPLLRMLADAREAPTIGRKGDRWGALVCFELTWGEEQRYWVRLQSRESLGDSVIANVEEPLGVGSFHHQGHYDGKALFRWIMTVSPERQGFRHQTGGPGCPPRRGVMTSPLLKGES
jgi:hypothetical protein